MLAMLANASSTRAAIVSLGANADEIGPFGAALAPPSEPRIDEIPRVKSIKPLSASPNGVGSIAAAWLPDTANGIAPPTVAPARPGPEKVRLWLPPRKLTVSLAPTSWMPPMMCEPVSRLSVSGPPKDWIALPPKLLTVPELVIVEVPPRATSETSPVVPELVTVALPVMAAVTSMMPVLTPELITLALPLKVVALMTPVLVPELTTL